MDFYDVLGEVIQLLQREGRASYRALKRQFDLDDDYLEDLKDAILYAHPVRDDGRGLVWIGAPAMPGLHKPSRSDEELRFQSLLPAVIVQLQGQRRVTYRTLKYVFGIDATLLAEIREELTFRRLVIDEDGKGLVWTGEIPSSGQPEVAVTSQQDTAASTVAISPASPALQPHVTATDARTNRLPTSSEASPIEVSPDERRTVPELVRSAPEAERRQLTVMFCDLVGSTDLSGKLDPEDLREVVRAYQETAAEVIERYEGHIAQYLGDGLMVYFGWPQAHEDDARRAVHTGIGIVEVVEMLNSRLEAEYDIQLAVRIGIHTGLVVVGEMAGGGRHGHLAMGETPNIAARLEGLAAPNTVVISATTARLVQPTFVLEELGAPELKGVSEPMVLARVIRPREAESDTEDATASEWVPLVGRDEEMGLLLRRWAQSKEGVGQVVLVSGEAGIGKSSLTEVLRAHVRREGSPRIAFRCSPYHTHSALHPVIEHIQRLLSFAPEDAASTKLVKLERMLHTYSLPLDEVVPLFAGLLSIPLLEERYPSLALTPQQQRQQTHDALVAWMLEEAERQPILVVWEDLHWADPSTLEQLGLLLEQVPTVPMLNVLTFRPDFTPPWPTRSHMTPLTLNRLERPQVESLIIQLANGKALPSEVVEHIVIKTDGVPLFVEELTKMLLASDLLREVADHYELTGPLLTVAIPDTLQESLMARLDQLNTAREVAQLGAVLGREFSYDMIQALATMDDGTLQDGLVQLVAAELLYQRGRPPRATYVFKHALIQDAAYASLLRSTRQQIHQRIAQLFEARFPDMLETQPEVMAYHYAAAGRAEQAIGYWHHAGQRALQRSANLEAIGHLRQGLALLPALPDTPTRTQQELELQMALGPALMATQGFAAPEVAQTYDRARDLCRRVGDTPQLFPVLHGLWRFYVNRAVFQTAYELGEQLLALAQHLGDPALCLEAHRALGQTVFWKGELLAVRVHMEEGLTLYDPHQHRAHAMMYGQDPGVVCYAFAAWAAWLLGYPDQARQRIEAALTLSRDLAHPFSLAYALICAAIVHRFRREGLASQAQAETVVILATEQRFVFWGAWGLILRGRALADQGQSDEGIAHMQQGLAAYEATGAAVFRPAFLDLLAETYGQVGNLEKGLVTLTEALTLVDTTGECFWAAELHRLKGDLLLLQSSDNQPEAASCFYQALDITRHQQAKSLELRTATSLARLWQQQDKRQEAYDLLAPVYNWFTEGFDTADLQEAKQLLDELAA
jgi:class 3 adenylate cyclase/predicted ATPase